MPSTAWVEAWIPSTSQGDDRVNVEPSLFKRSEEHTSELQSRLHVVCRLLLEQKQVRHRLPFRVQSPEDPQLQRPLHVGRRQQYREDRHEETQPERGLDAAEHRELGDEPDEAC